MDAAGIKRLDMPANTSVLSMRGGNGLVAPAPGDDVELYVDAGNGKGEWQGGYTALSKVEAGEMGDAYDGKDIVWVGKEGQNQAYGEEPLRGMPWPVEFMRLVKGDKPTFQGAVEEEEPIDAELSFSVVVEGDTARSFALFFRPDQARNYHGRWVDEGRGDLRSKTPMGEMLDDAIRMEKATDYVKAEKIWREKYNNTPESIERNLLDVYSRMTPAEQAEYGSWYYEVHDMAVEWAADLSKGGKTVRMEQVAAVIAALSPQTGWVGRNDIYGPEEDRLVSPTQWSDNVAKRAMLSNQGFAWKVLRVVFERGDAEINITEEMAVDLELGEYTPINYHSYNGADQTDENRGKKFVGKFKYRDLPADVLMQLLAKDGGELEGVMYHMGTSAIRLARGAHPDDLRPGSTDPYRTALNGPKVRSFYDNIVNPNESMDSTWDVHMQRAGSNNPAMKTSEGAKMVASAGAYQFLHDIMVKAAAKVGIMPHELQAAVWVQWRKERGQAEYQAWQLKHPGENYPTFVDEKRSAKTKAANAIKNAKKREERKAWRLAHPNGPANPPKKGEEEEE